MNVDLESQWEVLGDFPESTTSSKHKRNVKDNLPSPRPKRPRTDPVIVPEPNDFFSSDFEFSDDDEAPALPTVREEEEVVAEPIEVRYRTVLRHVPDVPYVPIACADGSRVYLRVFPESTEKSVELNKVKKQQSKPKCLLAVGFHDLRKQAELSRDRFHEALARVVDTESLGTETQEDLWVEKYKPKSYWDLLSEESLNRNLLHWLKLWDKTVFGNDYLAKYKETKEKYAKLEAKEKGKENVYSYHKPSGLNDEDYDETGRPLQKIALLHGPPGLGKTTCAHIVARHAGYKVIELNASDDRSKEIFEKTLDSATRMRPEVFQDGRPSCLVIDEIDGAPTEAINTLIDWIVGKASEKGKKKLKKVLKRPVICICNDLYAVSLKNLRQHAFILQFQPVSVSNLVERMKEVSVKEQLAMDSVILHKLCEKTECDIRSCLSSMQFLKQKKIVDSEKNIFDQIAKKDSHKGIFAVWNEIFKLPEGKSRYNDTEDVTKPAARFQNILKSVQNFGDYEKLQSGVFENYLNVKFRDSYFQSVIEGLEWTQWFEQLRSYIAKSQNYSAFGYLPMYFVSAHFLYAAKNMARLRYPSAEKLARIPRFKSIIESQLADISPNVGRFLDETNMVLDIIPSVIPILQPGTIRPIPTQLWNASERETVANIVSLMITYNLSYEQERTEDGAYNFVLEPNIEAIGRFNLQEGTTRPKFPYTVKQLVSREINLEKLRRNEFASSSLTYDSVDSFENTEATTDTGESQKLFDTKSPKKEEPMDEKPTTSSSSSSGMKVKPVKIPKPVIQLRDFFGRPIVRTAAAIKADEEKQKSEKQIWFRYKEGYSNAVKKNIKLKDLL